MKTYFKSVYGKSSSWLSRVLKMMNFRKIFTPKNRGGRSPRNSTSTPKKRLSNFVDMMMDQYKHVSKEDFIRNAIGT